MLPQFLMKIDSNTNVPVIASWVGCFFQCLICLLFNFITLLNVSSLQTLLMFGFISVGVIMLRLRPKPTDHEIHHSPYEPLVWFFTLNIIALALISGYLVTYSFTNLSTIKIVIISVITISCVISYIYLSCLEQPGVSDSNFKCPFVPLIPGFCIFVNFFLATQTMLIIWVYVLLLEIIGLLIYLFYGYRYSKLHDWLQNLEDSIDFRSDYKIIQS